MFYKYICFLTVIFLFGIKSNCSTKFDIKEFLPDEPLTPRKVAEEVLKYFQQDDPRGIPVLEVPETVNLKGPVQASQLIMNDVFITGHSQTTLEYIDVNLEKLQFQIRLNIPRLEVLAQYLWEGWWSNSEGDLNVTLINMDIGGTLDFGINDNGIIEVIDLNAVINPESFIPYFTGLNQMHSVAVFTADSAFESVVLPLIQSKAREYGVTNINQNLEMILKNKPFPVDISPVDYLIAKVRSDIVKKRNLDPFKLKEIEKSYFGTSIVLKSVELRGLSTLHRSDIIRTEMVDGRIYVTIELGTQRLQGSTDWTVYTSLLPVGSGHAEIIIDSLRVSVEAQQDVDVRHPPILRRIDIEIGNIALRSKGERVVDYFLEAVVNIIPNILRNKIMDKKVEGMVKKIIQERFNKINLQHIIYEQLEKMEKKKQQM